MIVSILKDLRERGGYENETNKSVSITQQIDPSHSQRNWCFHVDITVTVLTRVYNKNVF